MFSWVPAGGRSPPTDAGLAAEAWGRLHARCVAGVSQGVFGVWEEA